MSHITLPDEQWADLADPKKVTERKRRPVMRAMASLLECRRAKPPPVEGDGPSVSQAELDALAELTEVVMVAVVEKWSFESVPITLDGLQDLPGDAYDALRAACAGSMVALLPDFAIDPDPLKAPTIGSSSGSSTS